MKLTRAGQATVPSEDNIFSNVIHAGNGPKRSTRRIGWRAHRTFTSYWSYMGGRRKPRSQVLPRVLRGRKCARVRANRDGLLRGLQAAGATVSHLPTDRTPYAILFITYPIDIFSFKISRRKRRFQRQWQSLNNFPLIFNFSFNKTDKKLCYLLLFCWTVVLIFFFHKTLFYCVDLN